MDTGLGIRPRYPPLHLSRCRGGNGAGASTASPALRTLEDRRTATAFTEAAEHEIEGADSLRESSVHVRVRNARLELGPMPAPADAALHRVRSPETSWYQTGLPWFRAHGVYRLPTTAW